MAGLKNPYSSGKYAREFERLKKMIERKRDYKQIAERDGCSDSWAYQKVRRFGLRELYLKYHPERRGSKGFDRDVKRLMRSELLRLIGNVPGKALSLEEIGEHFGYVKERASQCLHEQRLYEKWKKMRKGAKMRGRGEE